MINIWTALDNFLKGNKKYSEEQIMNLLSETSRISFNNTPDNAAELLLLLPVDMLNKLINHKLFTPNYFIFKRYRTNLLKKLLLATDSMENILNLLNAYNIMLDKLNCNNVDISGNPYILNKHYKIGEFIFTIDRVEIPCISVKFSDEYLKDPYLRNVYFALLLQYIPPALLYEKWPDHFFEIAEIEQSMLERDNFASIMNSFSHATFALYQYQFFGKYGNKKLDLAYIIDRSEFGNELLDVVTKNGLFKNKYAQIKSYITQNTNFRSMASEKSSLSTSI